MKFVKKLQVIVPFIFILLFTNTSLMACEIDLTVIKGKKSVYKPGDEIIVKLSVYLTHRGCPEGIKKTDMDIKGMEILQATKWRESSTGTFERKFKIKITDKGTLHIAAKRKCDKEGGAGKLVLKSK